MTAITQIDKIPAIPSGAVVTMGDFDGLHTGHRVLIDATVARSRQHGLTSVLVTYEPSPKKILKRLTVDSRLTTFAEKQAVLRDTGLDLAVFFPVTADTLKISARSFLRHFLLGQLRMRHIVMGNDHHFGHNRRGNAAYLLGAGKRYGFGVEIVEEQMTLERRTSSSRIRAALLEGDIGSVNAILGRPYSVGGPVIRGEARGRTLGFPTANVGLDPEKLLPLPGVYYGIARLGDGHGYPAVANLGRKPTAGDHPLGLEVHLLNFSGDLYGTELRFEFRGRIRGERRFASLDDLRLQIEQDVLAAQQKFVSLD
ncbi:MAG: riboflavin biosynthesis protein RibF [Spirochaetota bacterium]